MNSQAKKLYAREWVPNRFAPATLAKPQNEELNYFNLFMDLDGYNTSFIKVDDLITDSYTADPGLENIVCMNSLNHISSLNSFIEKANDLLPEQGLLAGNFKPKENREKAMREAYYPVLFYPLYFIDFMWHRVFSKLKFTRPIYEKINDGGPRVFALAEALGRIAAGGFKIVDYKQIDGQVYFIARKVQTPSFENTNSGGLFFTMSRISKGGEIKDFYKLRTMHLYAEYLQNFVYEKNGLKNGDKFNNDFRVTTWGKFFRKYWLDELPMIFNLLKGDLKLVGVRPLSNHKFKLYSRELQEFRIKFKPGLVPPYYVDMPGSLEETMDSELRYLKSYEKKPFRTDFKYFIKAMYNIIVKHARSH